MTTVSMEKLVEFGVAFMTKQGVPEEKARHMAEVVVEAEAFHRSTHGIVQYNSINGLLSDGVDPNADPKVIRDQGAVGLIDGEGCLAILAMKRARERSRRRCFRCSPFRPARQATSSCCSSGRPVRSMAIVRRIDGCGASSCGASEIMYFNSFSRRSTRA